MFSFPLPPRPQDFDIGYRSFNRSEPLKQPQEWRSVLLFAMVHKVLAIVYTPYFLFLTASCCYLRTWGRRLCIFAYLGPDFTCSRRE